MLLSTLLELNYDVYWHYPVALNADNYFQTPLMEEDFLRYHYSVNVIAFPPTMKGDMRIEGIKTNQYIAKVRGVGDVIDHHDITYWFNNALSRKATMSSVCHIYRQ